MLLRLLRLGLLSLLFVPQTRPASSIIEESVKELIVKRTVGSFDTFTVKMKTDRTCKTATCTSLGAHFILVAIDGSSCSCRCHQSPFTFLSSIQGCAGVTEVKDFGGELSKHHTVNLYITKSSVKQTILFAPLQAPWPFVVSRFYCSPGLSGSFFFATESLPLTRGTGGCFY